MTLTPDDLAVDFFPQAGFAEPDARADAWRQFRAAVHALAGGLGENSPNSGRQAGTCPLRWNHEDAGWLAAADGPLGEVIAWIDPGGASVWIERREPQEGAWIELDGRTPRDVEHWARRTADRLSGRKPSEPGGQTRTDREADQPPFAFDDPDARADLEAIYEGAGLLLDTLAHAADRLGWIASEPEIDTATGRADPTCELTIPGRTNAPIAVGFAAPSPEEHDAAPHWFVRTRATADGQSGEGQPHTLPLADYLHHESGEAQHAAIAGFLAEAVNAIAASDT